MSRKVESERVLAAAVALITAFGVLHADSSPLTGRMNVARSGHQATLLWDGQVLVTGGSDQNGQAIGRAEIYNPFTGAWGLTQANIVPRLGHAAARLHDERVLVVGGAAVCSQNRVRRKNERALVFAPETYKA
jgi:hypothetical protein